MSGGLTLRGFALNLIAFSTVLSFHNSKAFEVSTRKDNTPKYAHDYM